MRKVMMLSAATLGALCLVRGVDFVGTERKLSSVRKALPRPGVPRAEAETVLRSLGLNPVFFSKDELALTTSGSDMPDEAEGQLHALLKGYSTCLSLGFVAQYSVIIDLDESGAVIGSRLEPAHRFL